MRPPAQERQMQWANQAQGNDQAPADGMLAQVNNNVAEETVRRSNERPVERSIEGRERLTSPGARREEPAREPTPLPPRAAPERARGETRVALGASPSNQSNPATRAPSQPAAASRGGAARGDRGASGAPGDARPNGAQGANGPLAAAGATPGESVVHAAGAGEHGTAGEGRANGGGGQSGQQGSSGDHGQNGQNGQNGQSPRRNTGTDTGYIARQLGIEGLGATRALAALSPTIGTLGSVYGSATLDRWRREDERRRAEARGDYASNWRQAVAAIETPVGNVRPGETTALRTRASPFAAYLVQMHDRIHENFAEGFISRVGGMPDGSPMNNPDLHSVLELAIDADGTIHHIRISQTSGWLPFDVGALNAVRAAAPFPETPEAIRSPDARVYPAPDKRPSWKPRAGSWHRD